MPKKSYTELVFELDALTKGNTMMSESEKVFRIDQINREMAKIQNTVGQTKLQF